ncbi:MAG: ATP-dependent Clp protease ATP-binding subunit, partial [Dehalococcoidia bacterium]|nr:ATP-dependent Clp protease ATP-binding subunit [Dehalococcoidia bacterium]
MMRLPKFTEQAQEVLAASQEVARSFRNSHWDVEHILLALLQQEGGVTNDVLQEIGVEPGQVRGKVEEAVRSLPIAGYETGQLYPTARIENVLRSATIEADRFQDEFVGNEHLLIAILNERGGRGADILKKFGVDQEKIYRALQQIRGGQRITDPRAESK